MQGRVYPGGPGRLGFKTAGRGSGEQARLAGQVDELTRALGETHVELRLGRRDGAPSYREQRLAGHG